MSQSLKVSHEDETQSQICQNVGNLMNHEDLSAIIKSQKFMLSHMEKMNEMLLNCNNISEHQYAILLSRFEKHTTVLRDMKMKLQLMHMRIRRIKSAMLKKAPDVQLPANTSQTDLGDTTTKDIDEPFSQSLST